MELAIFGATGRTGRHLVERALAAGHHVRAFARIPARLDIQHDNLSIVQGDIQDAASVEQAVAGVEAVVSVLGPTGNTPEHKISRGIENILSAMHKNGVRRLVISAGAGVADPNDQPELFNKVMGSLVKLISRHVYEDMVRTVETVRGSDVDWTVVRVPMLTDDAATGNVRVGYVGKEVGPRLSRQDMAQFMLRQVTDDTYVHKAPAISN